MAKLNPSVQQQHAKISNWGFLFLMFYSYRERERERDFALC
jgi:hypothetical protein